MTKNIVEDLPTRKHPVAAQKPEAGKEKPQDPEKKVKQAVYDIRYRARREEVPLRTAYSQYMSNSGLGGNERTIVKKKLFGDGPMKENFVAEVESEAKETLANTLVKVFVGEDLTSPKKYKVRVTDKSGKSYVRMADRAKITELRANSNIESVEMTDHGEPYEGEKKRGEQTAKAKGGGKLDPVGKEDGDVDNDGDKDSSDSYLLKRRKAIAKAMAKEEFIADAVDEEDSKKKLDVMKGKNKIKVLTKSKNGTYDEAVVSRFRSILAEEDKVVEKKKEKEEADPRGMKTTISLYKNKLRAMGMKMEHHQKDKDGNTIPHEGEEVNEALGQLAGGVIGNVLAPKLAKVGVTNAIAQKAIGTAAGAAAGEVLDPFKKGKDKNPVAAAAGGAVGGAIQGGGIGALAKKFPETAGKIKNIVNPKTTSSVADNIKKNDALKDKFKNNPNKYFGTEVNSYEPEGDELVETPKIDQKIRKDAKPIKAGGLYKTDQSKESMGQRGVRGRRDTTSAMNRSGMGYAKMGREQQERQQRHKADRGVKTKGTKAGHSGSAYPKRSHTMDTMYPHKKTARLKAKAASMKKGMSEGMATPESGTGKYYNEKKPTEMQLAKRKKMEKVKSLTNQGKHKEASALYKESLLSRFNSKVKEQLKGDN